MPKVAQALTDRAVKNLKHPEQGSDIGPVAFAVGGVAGLHLQITASGNGRSWLLRYMAGGKRRTMGLGPYPEVGLAEAREQAREMRHKIRAGVDPITEKRKAKQGWATAVTFAQAIDGWDKENPHKFSNDRHRDSWLRSVRSIKELSKLHVDQIEDHEVWAALKPMADRTPETARRVRGRIAAVLDWAEDEKHCKGPNPANTGWIKRKLMAKMAGIKISHYPALKLDDVPRWFAALRKREGMGSRALEFLALTASRSGEVRGATWDEIDLDNGMWIIPAERMKMDREHRVPMPTSATALLKALPRFENNPLIFPAQRGGQMSDMTLSATMKRINAADKQGFVDRVSKRPAVPHGLRSTFRDWAAERTHFDPAMAELALAHKIGNAVEAAYRRGDMVEKRRVMMDAWSDHLRGTESASKVVRLA